jgi:hypothetical protein
MSFEQYLLAEIMTINDNDSPGLSAISCDLNLRGSVPAAVADSPE